MLPASVSSTACLPRISSRASGVVKNVCFGAGGAACASTKSAKATSQGIEHLPREL